MAEKFSFGWTLDALMVSFFTPTAIVKYMILGAKLMPCCLVSFGEVIGSGCQQGLRIWLPFKANSRVLKWDPMILLYGCRLNLIGIQVNILGKLLG
jgi:hypothetical protein